MLALPRLQTRVGGRKGGARRVVARDTAPPLATPSTHTPPAFFGMACRIQTSFFQSFPFPRRTKSLLQSATACTRVGRAFLSSEPTALLSTTKVEARRRRQGSPAHTPTPMQHLSLSLNTGRHRLPPSFPSPLPSQPLPSLSDDALPHRTPPPPARTNPASK